MSKTQLLIAGMRDNGCRESISASLRAVPGVQDVHVTLDPLYRSFATIIHQLACAAADLNSSWSAA